MSRQVSVSLIFSKNSKIGSKIISCFTEHLNSKKYAPKTPSHAALLIENRWVFESTLENGIKITSFSSWSNKGNEVVHIHYLGEYNYSFIKELYRSLEGSKYDWLGVVYLGIKILLNKLLSVLPIGHKNLLENPKKYFCTEVIEHLINYNLSMTSPVQLMELVNSKDNYKGID